MKDGENQENLQNSTSGDHDINMSSEENTTENQNEEKDQTSNSQK